MAETFSYDSDPAPAVLLVASGDTTDALAALAAVEARIVDRVGWNAVDQLGTHAVRPIILAEAEAVDDDLLVDALPRLDSFAAGLEVPLIVVIDEAQIDLAAAGLMGRRVQILCRPAPTDRAAALIVAGATLGGGGWVHDVGREAESTRLAKLNSEVARIAEVLARLTAADAPRDDGDGIAERRMTFNPQGGDTSISPGEVRQAIRARRLRDQFFEAELFGDPAWDMLLDLFAAELERAEVSVSSLCIAAAVAPTTALRWISNMTAAGLLVRRPDPFDRRRAFMALSTRARQAMRGYFAAATQGRPVIA